MALENSPTVGHFAHPQHQSCFHLRLKILIPKIYKSHIPEPSNDFFLAQAFTSMAVLETSSRCLPTCSLVSPEIFIISSTLRPWKVGHSKCSLEYMDTTKTKTKTAKKQPCIFVRLQEKVVNPENLFWNFLGFQFSCLPKPPGRLGIVQMLHQSLRPRCQCRSVTGRLGKKRRNFESLKSRCKI